MKFSISKIVNEWAYRVKNGCPDSNNKQHLRVLSEVLCDFGYTNGEANSIIHNIKNPNSEIEDFQRFCVEIGKILSEEELITEASISLAKYTVGHQVTLKDSAKVNAVKWWQKRFGTTPKILTKVKLQDVPEERTATIGSGKDEVCLKDDSGNIYKIVGSPDGIGGKFNHYKSEEAGVKWKDTTLESAALAGLSFNPQPYINSLLSGNETVAAKAQKEAIKAMKSALSNGEMRAGGSVATGIEKSIPDLIMALELANGLYKFASDKGCLGWNFIHKKIDSYYNAHNKNPKLGDAKAGGKVPTPDCIIVKGSPDSLIKNIESDDVKYTGDGKCTTDSGDIFWQISNKKSAAGAQLGRITGLVKARYGLPKWSAGVAFMFEDIGKYENSEFLLNEGLKDYFQKGLKYLKDKFQSTISAIRGRLKGIGSSIISSLKKTSTKPADVLIKKLGKGLKLEEAKKPQLNAWTFSKAVTSEYHKGNQKRYKDVVGHAIKAYNAIKVSPSDGTTKTPSSTPPFPGQLPKGNPGANTVIKFMVNYLAYDTMKTMMGGQSGNIKTASKILEDFVELEKEMHFGSTNLPIYKVYMSNDGSGAYSYLFSGAEFREKKSSILDEFKSKNIPGLIIESNAQSAGYTNNSVYVLNDFQQDGPTYTQIAYRSSGDNKLTFSVQGTTTRTWPWMIKNKKVAQ
jgi:hypothetical protein